MFDIERIAPCEETEKPLDILRENGGFTSIFRTFAVVGDSLASGELESLDENGIRDYHDYYDISWGQYLARAAGCKAYNFSCGGLTAKVYNGAFGDYKDVWNPEKACQAYIMALGYNDLKNENQPVGTAEDCKEDWHDNPDTFAGHFGKIIQRYKEIQPDAVFFLLTMSSEGERESEHNAECNREHRKLMYELAEKFSNTYVIDLLTYGPVYDLKYYRKYYTGYHLNTMGYYLTSVLVGSYIDYIVRHNPDKFNQAGFIGTPFRYLEPEKKGN